MTKMRSIPLLLASSSSSCRLLAARLTMSAVPSAATGAADVAVAYSRLKGLLRDAAALSEVEGILSYDEQCFMPTGAGEARAAQKAALAKVIHRARTGPEMAAAIEAVRGRADALDDARARANVRDAVEAFDKETRKSPELAEREARLESEAFAAWKEARAEAKFELFAPKLEELFELKREVACLTRPSLAEPYDGALDAFERGMTADRLDVIFSELREGLVPLLNEVLKRKTDRPEVDMPHPALAPGPQWSVEKQAELSRVVGKALGYSFENGRLDVSTHPFTGGAGPTDVRITTRFSDNWVEGFGATIHETGLLTMALLTMALLTIALLTMALLTMALLTKALLTIALLTMALLTMALLTMALLTMALLTMALLTMALLTMALLTMALLTVALLWRYLRCHYGSMVRRDDPRDKACATRAILIHLYCTNHIYHLYIYHTCRTYHTYHTYHAYHTSTCRTWHTYHSWHTYHTCHACYAYESCHTCSSYLHATGHALYEQGRDVSEEGRGLPSSVSMVGIISMSSSCCCW